MHQQTNHHWFIDLTKYSAVLCKFHDFFLHYLFSRQITYWALRYLSLMSGNFIFDLISFQCICLGCHYNCVSISSGLRILSCVLVELYFFGWYWQEMCIYFIIWVPLKFLIQDTPKPNTKLFHGLSCNYHCPIYWSQVLSQEWRCRWSSAVEMRHKSFYWEHAFERVLC